MESLILVPVAAALWKMSSKVSDLRDRVQTAEQVIATQQATITDLQSQGGTGSSTAAGASGAWKAVAFTSVAVSGALVALNLSRLRASHDGTAPSSRPPANYAPRVATDEATACCVCAEYERDTVVQPCGHFALCWACSESVAAGPSSRSASVSGAAAGPEPPSPTGGAPAAQPDAAPLRSSSSGGGLCPICRAHIATRAFVFTA